MRHMSAYLRADTSSGNSCFWYLNETKLNTRTIHTGLPISGRSTTQYPAGLSNASIECGSSIIFKVSIEVPAHVVRRHRLYAVLD